MKPTRRQFLRTTGVAIGASTLCATPWRVLAQTSVRPAPNMPEPRFIETNGIRMGVYEAGAGLPVVFCHGFPELAYSWRHQIQAFSEAGYRTIAPDQRGYGLTERPGDISDYTLKELCDDMAGLLAEMGCILCKLIVLISILVDPSKASLITAFAAGQLAQSSCVKKYRVGFVASPPDGCFKHALPARRGKTKNGFPIIKA